MGPGRPVSWILRRLLGIWMFGHVGYCPDRGDSGGSSSRRVGLSRSMLGSVGVKIGVKDRGQLADFRSVHGAEGGVRPDKGPSVSPK